MSNEQLVAEIKQGINTKNNIEELFLRNRGFIIFIIHKTLKTSIIGEDDLDDFIQGSYFALLKAINGFNTDKNCKFLTYFEYHIMNRLLRVDATYSITFHKHSLIYLDKQIVADENSNISLIDTIPDESAQNPFDRFEDADYSIRIWDSVKRALPDEQMFNILVHRCILGKSKVKVAKDLNISMTVLRTFESKTMGILRRNRDFQIQTNHTWEETAYRSNGYSRFNTTWTSSTERAALLKIKNTNARKNYLEYHINSSV